MPKSIFHVRPRDDGKGWAIDEYDGRGAWQATYQSHRGKTPINKIEAQRRVFQLRREAINSEPVNADKAVNNGSGCQPIPSSEEGRKRLRPGLHPAGLLPPYIESEMVLCDPETGLRWKVDGCRSGDKGVVADLVEPSRSMTMACNVLRTWPLGEDWEDEDEASEAEHAR